MTLDLNKSEKQPLIKVQDISLTLPSLGGAVDILKNISFEVNLGDQVSIVGPSGSGKTSLLMVLAGLERCNKGQIFIAGQDFSLLNEDELAKFRRDTIGIVFQNFHLISTMTALENVALPLELAGAKLHANPLHSAQKILERLGLGKRLHHYPAQLSGGEQQRVALARAFIGAPKLILADEPTGNLDHETGDNVIEFLFELCKEHGTALLLITHDPKLAQKCHYSLTMQDGILLSQTKKIN